MSKFLTPDLDGNCPICIKPLRTAGMPVVELNPCKHKFHERCIKILQEPGSFSYKKCPICRREIESLVPVTLITPPLPNNNSSNNNNSGPPLPGSTSGGGTRKKRSNKRKKTKTRSAR